MLVIKLLMFSRFRDYRVLQSITEYSRVLQSITEYYRVLQSVAECCRVLQSVAECCRVLQSVAECFRVLQSFTECYRVLQSITECYRVLESISSASTWTNFWACLSWVSSVYQSNLNIMKKIHTLDFFKEIPYPFFSLALKASATSCV